MTEEEKNRPTYRNIDAKHVAAHQRGDYHHDDLRKAPGNVEEQESQDNSNKEEDFKQSKWPLIITGILIAALVASYFIFPGFQQEVDKAWDVLTSGDKQRISDWVSQFGFFSSSVMLSCT